MDGLDDDARLAAAIAAAAGELLIMLRDAGLLAGRALGDAGDAAADALILAALRQHRPDDAILSEESADGPERLAQSRVWIVDPLDGTREYREGREDWAVHVALAVDGIASVGAVALPARGIVLASDAVSPPPGCDGPPRMVVSRSRPPELCCRAAEAIGATLVPMGSAGAKAMAVVLGEADIYVHAGGQYQWDNCAPAAVAAAAGLHVSRLDGSPLRYNGADTELPDLLICRHGLAERVIAASSSRS